MYIFIVFSFKLKEKIKIQKNYGKFKLCLHAKEAKYHVKKLDEL